MYTYGTKAVLPGIHFFNRWLDKEMNIHTVEYCTAEKTTDTHMNEANPNRLYIVWCTFYDIQKNAKFYARETELWFPNQLYLGTNLTTKGWYRRIWGVEAR